MFTFVSTAVAMTTQPLVKKEPPEEDVMSTSVDPTGMCMDGLTLPYTRQPTFCMCAHVHVPVVVA